MVSDSCSRMFPFPLLSAMQEDRPRTGIVSVSGNRRGTKLHERRYVIPRHAFRFRTSHRILRFGDALPFADSSLPITLPLPGSRNRIMRTAGPPVRQPANLQQKNDPNNVLLFRTYGNRLPGRQENSNGTRSCAPTSAHCSSLKFTPHKTGGSSFADNTSGIATA